MHLTAVPATIEFVKNLGCPRGDCTINTNNNIWKMMLDHYHFLRISKRQLHFSSAKKFVIWDS